MSRPPLRVSADERLLEDWQASVMDTRPQCAAQGIWTILARPQENEAALPPAKSEVYARARQTKEKALKQKDHSSTALEVDRPLGFAKCHLVAAHNLWKRKTGNRQVIINSC